MIQYIKLNNTKQIQINDSGKGVYYALVWFWKGRKTKITYGELSDKSGVSDHGIRFWLSALRNIGVIQVEDESSYLSFTLKQIERDNVEFIYSNF
ncbi:hypothetical protein CXH12_19120 [Citrobacter portucalensis]|nr:hypothetical protein CXH12_19120 [Citrobacter portucalensis]